FKQGHAFNTINQVVLGSEVASKLNYKLGDSIVISHGMGSTSFHHPDDNPFKVVGILNATGTPVDKTLHIPLAAIDLIHGGHSAEHEEHSNLVGHPKQITAFLMGFNSPLYTLQIRRNIN
ncbi:ABC transporter permease, partial [Pseudoalteromonas sp. GW168-MNA-CIBAN-0100]|uniref:ABC transporter permease n=1 Tax=Pseudoalteromonas sp. GW168-MNA-CIBAN-0100 TaxID=3140434 RepID=UPI00331ACC9A